MDFPTRPTRAEIDLDNLSFNYRSIKKFVGEEIEFMAVIKADAYGHGAVRCAKKLEHEGADWFGVALPEEGYELRKDGIEAPILCLGGFWKGQENYLIENDLTPVIFQLEKADLLNSAAKSKNIKANVHIKIDTGMGRVGVRFDEVKDFAAAVKSFSNLNVEGLMTHFAVADDLDESDFTRMQIKRFDEAVETFEANGIKCKYKDLANSPGAIAFSDSRKNLIRIGGILYGLGDDVLPLGIDKPELKPVLSLKTKIACLKKVPKGESLGYGRTFKTTRNSLVATIPIGYQDGYSRLLSNNSQVIVNDCFAPVIGRISMDWTILDVSDVPNVKVDDEVVLIGKQNGLEIKAKDLAEKLQTISYEITCGISRRVTRIYVESE